MKRRNRNQVRLSLALSAALLLTGCGSNEQIYTLAASSPPPIGEQTTGCLASVTINSVNELVFQGRH
jgi:uncharacterized lipoprotein YmbA